MPPTNNGEHYGSRPTCPHSSITASTVVASQYAPASTIASTVVAALYSAPPPRTASTVVAALYILCGRNGTPHIHSGSRR